jgi:integrase
LPQAGEALNAAKAQNLRSVDDYVFTDKKGRPIDKHLDRIWARALRAVGLRHHPSYQLRHTLVTQCIVKQLPSSYVAQLSGHTTIDTLVRHYAGWIEDTTQKYQEKLQLSFQPKKALQEGHPGSQAAAPGTHTAVKLLGENAKGSR